MSTKVQKKTEKPEEIVPAVAAPEAQGSAEEGSDNTTAVETDKKDVPVRGRNVSGRNWKSPKQRYNTMVQNPSLKTSWEKKQEKRQKMQQMKERAAELKAQAEAARQELADRQKANRERRAENAIKSSQYQVIKNTSKLRKMSRKQLQQFKKQADVAKF